jgi:hypothetical protein
MRSLCENDATANQLIESFAEIEAIYVAAKEAMGIESCPKIENCNATSVKLTFNTSDLLARF